ncbi:hypothetical protein [Anaeroselena agilis]|uniref:Phage capsid protein n=1 Tax=Anaeroselena agilis TaxID=3063788 RepID=A0ABU3NV01_9FIRM|nr:phage capsid protein [Selenomonadales bacterium 4137-cl]
MSIIVATPGRDVNATTPTNLDSFMKVFSGEVLTAYSRASKTEGRHFVRTISAGKAANFPVLGRTTARYLPPGKSLDEGRQNIPGTELPILIDGLLVADAMITDLDDAMNHFDVRAPYSTQLGEALAYAADGAVVAELAKLVVADEENLTGLGKGAIVAKSAAAGTAITSATLGALYLDMLLEMQYNMDANNVPESDRVAYIAPDVSAALVNAKVVINSDYGGSSNIQEGRPVRVAGFNLVNFPNLTRGGASTTDILQGDGHIFPATYASTAKIVAAHRSAVGTLKLIGLGMEHARRAEYQADMFVAKYAMGHRGLRPEAVQMGTMTIEAG